MRLSLRRPAPQQGLAETAADPILEQLLDREEIIDRFDASYVDDLPAILLELHGVTAENARGHELWPLLERLWEASGRAADDFDLEQLPAVLLDDVGVDPRRFGPKQASTKVKRRYRHNRVASWGRASGLRVGDAQAPAEERELVNELQKEYSIQSHGDTPRGFDDLSRPETGDPWTPFIVDLRERGIVSADEPTLTIGPRWLGEIHYFRERLGLKGAIGLDLFSEDEELVTVGDMHDMPFDDDTFGLVYQRNTFDKSYDIRAALRECVRILRDGGVLISDDCYAYTDGVSEVSRTSIKHNRQVVRVIQDRVAEVLYDHEADSGESWIERVGQVAIRISK
jgi:SAM-dependent methyltransferase